MLQMGCNSFISSTEKAWIYHFVSNLDKSCLELVYEIKVCICWATLLDSHGIFKSHKQLFDESS